MSDSKRSQPSTTEAAPSKLSKDHKEKVTAWFEDKLKGKPAPGCPLCASKNWSIGEDFVATTNFSSGGLLLGGEVYPYFMLICDNCGNTQLVNAIAAKVLERPSE